MVEIISDGFGGTSGGIQGRTPDTTNTPGNTWQLKSAGSYISVDGSGNCTATAVSDGAQIDTGVTNDQYSAQVDFNANGGDNRLFVGILGNLLWESASNGPNEGLQYNVRDTTEVLAEEIAPSTFTELASQSVTRNQSTTYTYKIQFDGTDAKCFRDGSERATLTQTSYSVPAGLTGNQYALFAHAAYVSAGGTFDNFVVDDLIVGGLTPRLSLLGVG